MALLRSILHDLSLAILVVAGVLACLVLWKALGTVDAVNVALATVNAPKSGTLSMLDDTIFQSRLTIDATNKVLLHEQNQLGTIDGYARNLDTEISGLADHSDTTLDSLAGSAAQATKTLNTASTSLQTITDGITPVLASTKSTVDDVGAAVGSVGTVAEGILPLESDADAAVRGLFPLEANAATITGNLGATTTDFQTKFHVFLFPAPCKTFGCKLARTWPYVRGATQMVEPLYWGQQLFENRTP
jgi:hypothetical protein